MENVINVLKAHGVGVGKKLVGDAAAGDVRAGKTFSNANGNDKVGTLAVQGGGPVSITPGTADQVLQPGIYDGAITVAGDADLVSTNIKAGVNIFGVPGNSNVVDTSAGDAVAANIRNGKKAYVDGALVTGNMTEKGAQTYTPGTTNQTIAANQYLTAAQTILGDADLIASNIKKGVNIFGVDGCCIPGAKVYANLVKNGNFFNNTNDWALVMANASVASNVISITNTASGGGIVQTIPMVANHVIYGYLQAQGYNTPSIFFNLHTITAANAHIADNAVQITQSGALQPFSYLFTTQVNTAAIEVTIKDWTASGWQLYKLSNIIVLDLTEIYGAGNEPTKAEMDATIALSGFFPGVSAVNPATGAKENLIPQTSRANVTVATGETIAAGDGVWIEPQGAFKAKPVAVQGVNLSAFVNTSLDTAYDTSDYYSAQFFLTKDLFISIDRYAANGLIAFSYKVTGRETTQLSSLNFATGTSYKQETIQACRISDTKFMVLFPHLNIGYIITVNATTGVMTASSSISLTAFAGHYTSQIAYAADGYAVCIAFGLTSPWPNYIICAYSDGTTITLGNLQYFNNPGNTETFGNAYYVRINDTTGYLVYLSDDRKALLGRYVYRSGTTLTLSSTISTLRSSANGMYRIRACRLNDGRIVASAVECPSTYTTYVVAGYFNGESLVVGTPISIFTATNNVSTVEMIPASDNDVLILNQNAYRGANAAYLANINGNAITVAAHEMIYCRGYVQSNPLQGANLLGIISGQRQPLALARRPPDAIAKTGGTAGQTIQIQRFI